MALFFQKRTRKRGHDRYRLILHPNKKPSHFSREGFSHFKFLFSCLCYPRTTFAAWNPLGPLSKSNSTVSPSFSER